MISRKDVEHIASLARIELAEAEKAKFEKDLSGILDFVAKLDELDIAGIEPLAGGTGLTNVMRDDEASDEGLGNGGQDLVKVAPKQRDGYVEVKAVFERE